MHSYDQINIDCQYRRLPSDRRQILQQRQEFCPARRSRAGRSCHPRDKPCTMPNGPGVVDPGARPRRGANTGRKFMKTLALGIGVLGFAASLAMPAAAAPLKIVMATHGS